MPPEPPNKSLDTEDPEPRIPFHFHGEAHAFSARFHRPIHFPIEAQASVSLPTIGGHAQSRVENFVGDHLVRFSAAHCHVSGSWMNKEVVTTHATATIEGLNILDFVTADRIVARLTSEHRVGDPEGHFIALGSTFEGLKIAGHDVKVTLRHELFVNCRTLAALREHLAKDKEPDKITDISTDRIALCSLAEDIDVKFPGLTKRGHILKIEHFGELAIAEVFAAFGTRTLTMLRFKLGSPSGGSGTVTEATTNGQPVPPAGPGPSGN
jgi:hypothetical protein